MSVSDVFLDAEFKNVSRIFLPPTLFAPGQRAAIFCVRALKCVFTEEFKDLFSQTDCVVLCNDVYSVMEVLDNEFNADQLRLFIDSSKVSLKFVLLYNGNKFPSFPLAPAANKKESYESVKLILGKIKFDEFEWKLCGDLKVVAQLRGMKLGYTKYCCFLCEWDSRDKKNHYVNKLWPK